MTVNYTTNLALGQPVTGTESGTWGDDVNNAVTSYLDIAIAGGLAIAITTADVTLANTQGTSAATNISSTTAQYAILNITGAKTAARSLIVPSSSKYYLVNNSAATGGFLLTVKGSATTGITLVDGEKAIVAWNGTDYVKIVSTALTNSTGTLAIANGGTGASSFAAAFLATYSGAETLTNKRINPRTSSTASTATLTPDISANDQYNLTAQAVGLTVAAPTGTPVDGNRLVIRILDNGTGQTISWNATYTVIGVTLPTTTTANKMIYVGCIYNSTNTRWDVVAVATQA